MNKNYLAKYALPGIVLGGLSYFAYKKYKERNSNVSTYGYKSSGQKSDQHYGQQNSARIEDHEKNGNQKSKISKPTLYTSGHFKIDKITEKAHNLKSENKADQVQADSLNDKVKSNAFDENGVYVGPVGKKTDQYFHRIETSVNEAKSQSKNLASKIDNQVNQIEKKTGEYSSKIKSAAEKLSGQIKTRKEKFNDFVDDTKATAEDISNDIKSYVGRRVKKD